MFCYCFQICDREILAGNDNVGSIQINGLQKKKANTMKLKIKLYMCFGQILTTAVAIV